MHICTEVNGDARDKGVDTDEEPDWARLWDSNGGELNVDLGAPIFLDVSKKAPHIALAG